MGKTGRADADFVKARTGFSIGGVSPLGHVQAPVTLIDRELFRFEEIWAAAGHPHAVFKLRPQDLERLTGAPVGGYDNTVLRAGLAWKPAADIKLTIKGEWNRSDGDGAPIRGSSSSSSGGDPG